MCIIPIGFFHTDSFGYFSSSNDLKYKPSGAKIYMMGKIGEDIVSEISGVKELAPTYRFFLDAYIDIPWGTNVSKSMEITINPIHL